MEGSYLGFKHNRMNLKKPFLTDHIRDFENEST